MAEIQNHVRGSINRLIAERKMQSNAIWTCVVKMQRGFVKRCQHITSEKLMEHLTINSSTNYVRKHCLTLYRLEPYDFLRLITHVLYSQYVTA